MTTLAPDLAEKHQRLRAILVELRRFAVAVSGGVDSVTLAACARALAAEGNDVDVTLFHAASAAVPREASERVRALFDDVVIVDAGEVADEAYAQNPVDRCYFCKSHLFDAVKTFGFDGPICTGANLDDVDDFRPGRKAAAERGVREPFVDAGFSKDDVRALARVLGLGGVADLPASPCLSSRVETGIRIDAPLLRLVDDVERAVRALGHQTVRCRVRPQGLVIEHDPEGWGAVDEAEVRARVTPLVGARALAFAPYRRGSAFLRVL